MLKTFNCGVGFCLIVKKKNFLKVCKNFSQKISPYIIGKILKNKKKIILKDQVDWSK